MKFLILQNPNIAHFFTPPVNGLTDPTLDILFPMIWAPELPKTRDKRVPILTIALCIIMV
jgi:hypothetical protein